MKKCIKKYAAAAALLMAVTGSWAQTPIKIGFIGELSGPTAVVGQDQLDGFNLLLERNGGKI